MREIVLDTETTGLDPADGHRIVEVACVELFNHVPTGRVFHRYVNPEREISDEAVAVHGLTGAFLAQHPPFGAVAEELLAFLAGDRLVIHNAEFDLRFLNAEFERLGLPRLAAECEDTLLLARKRFPGAQASLDALCRRFGIDLSQRTKHNARLDCELLAAVYLELIGGRQPGLDLAAGGEIGVALDALQRPARPARPHTPSAEELAAHAAFLAKIKEPIWKIQ
ncbi:MAG TPA: DNA polymerase III subunit epsilon [Stellaceae bacterium]|jgi:DNA polymerase-3 subunit epsilon|nr:DNA polymerase III subunit epsilon [Stellaceae bacterium]